MATAADILVESLAQWGVTHVFGIPGDGINGVVEALRKRRRSMRFVQARHGDSAAFMACAYAKYTGRLGVCLGSSGAGAIQLLNGLYDAKMDQAPVLALTGQVYSDLIGSYYREEVNLLQLFGDVARYNQMVLSARDVALLAHEACRTSLAEQTVSHISFPIDLQEEEVSPEELEPEGILGRVSSAYARPITLASSEDVARAAAVLNQGKRVAILAGRGALGARDILIQVADALGAPIVKALLGKAVVPDDHPLTTGGIGLLGTGASQAAMEGCDTLLIVGSSFPYTSYLPKPEQARGVQIDIRADRLGLRYPVEVGLVGDSAAVLSELMGQLKRKRDRSFLKSAQRSMADWLGLLRDRATRTDRPIKPQVVAHLLNEVASEDAIVSTDSGTVTTWIARHFHVRPNQMFSLSGNLASMACGIPYAIAAQVAYPHRQSIAFVGDGAFTMLMGEFATAVKHDLPIKVIVMRNNALAQVRWEQMVFLGNPEYGTTLQPIEFARYAKACGGLGIYVEDPGEVRAALKRAMASDSPSLVEVLVDPYEPPWPPKITWDQAARLAESLVRGEPNRERIALTLFRDKVSEVFR